MAVAINYKIPLVMYGENGEVEYGGDLKNADVPTHNVTDDMTKHYFSGIVLFLKFFERLTNVDLPFLSEFKAFDNFWLPLLLNKELRVF